MSPDSESLILGMLRDMQGDMAAVRGEVANLRSHAATKDDLAALRTQLATKQDLAELRGEVRSDMHSLRADFASDLLTFRKELGEQIVGLRRAVIEYHTTVIGHGILISDLEGRVRRIEQHLDLPTMETR